MLHAALATITGSYHPVDCTRLRLQFIGHTKTTRKRASHGLDIESACITSIICLLEFSTMYTYPSPDVEMCVVNFGGLERSTKITAQRAYKIYLSQHTDQGKDSL